MDCGEVSAQLPWLLGSSLEPAQKQAVLAHLAGCPGCRQDLAEAREAAAVFGAHLPAAALVDLAWDRPPTAISAATAERHLATCAACAEELALLRESRRLEREAVRPWPVVRYAGMAAAIVLAFVGGWWWGERPDAGGRTDEAERRQWTERLSAAEAEAARLRAAGSPAPPPPSTPQVNVPVTEVFPRQARRGPGGAEENEVVVPAGASLVVLVLSSAHAPPRPVAVELRDPAGHVLWKGSGLRPGPLGGYTLGIPASLLAEGRLVVAVLDEGRPAPLETYALRVRRAPSSF